MDPPASHRLATFPERHLVGEALAGGLRGVQCTFCTSQTGEAELDLLSGASFELTLTLGMGRDS